ncbi:MAG TPA: TIGR04295 family B12-binding domain-containing radical SAM protein [Bryobacteraceae bacterium]
MRFSLINPPWNFEGSIYFGCREPHLPLEFGYSKALLERDGHEVRIVDAQLDELTLQDVRSRVQEFRPDFTVVTTAPSYLFWRCAPPELHVPATTLDFIRDVAGFTVAVGPHGSTTPGTTLRKLGVDAVILGECEEILPLLASGDARRSTCTSESGAIALHGIPHASDMNSLPALRWEPRVIAKHLHHHHRFDSRLPEPGAEMETSRGCPYHCTFCAKDNFRNSFRRRPLTVIAEELDGLIAAGARYVYFIDEIFLPFRDVLELIGERRIPFGIQTRIDLWGDDMIDLLASAGCVSIEAGVESITEEGRAALDKKCRISTDAISRKLIRAKRRVSFVQANLMNSKDDDPAGVRRWREFLIGEGVWANEPVPMFPYPGSPDYTRRWGAPDEFAWERAHEAYLSGFESFSDIQESRPLPLVQLEAGRRTHV